MAQTNELINSIKTTIDRLLNTDIEKFIRKEDLGKELSFEEIRPTIIEMLNIFRKLQNCTFETFPDQFLSEIAGRIKAINDLFNNMLSFSPTQNAQPINERNGIFRQFQDRYRELFVFVVPALVNIKDNDQLFESAKGKIQKALIDAEEQLKILQNAGKEAQQTLDALKQASGQVAISKYSTVFEREAEQHEKSAIKWLIATVVVALLTIAWGLSAQYIFRWIYGSLQSGDTPMLIQYAISKLIILSALYYALVWCARIYGAHRHNNVINRHRQNALNTFEAFVHATEGDPTTKNAVLLQATQSIFSGQHTGFVSKESESESPNKIIEILRNVSSSGGK
ncbi:MAG: hypothetical protein ABR936_04145 [Bacteroidota bacterium]|jgi:hypothetical protein